MNELYFTRVMEQTQGLFTSSPRPCLFVCSIMLKKINTPPSSSRPRKNLKGISEVVSLVFVDSNARWQ